MRRRGWLWTATLVGCWLVEGALGAQTGRVAGRIVDAEGAAVGGVLVESVETGSETVTDPEGRFVLELPSGASTLRFELLETRWDSTVDVPLAATRSFEVVAPDLATDPSRELSMGPAGTWRLSGDELLPSTVRDRRDLRLRGGLDLLPEVFEGTAPVEVAQSTLRGFELNARGLNGYTTPRIGYELDGRDIAGPFFGVPSWPSVVVSMEHLIHAEVTRGPSSTLYGGNAEHGVLHLVTRSPSAERSGFARVLGGEGSTFGGDLGWSGKLVDSWFLAVSGRGVTGEGFSTSRSSTVEYSGLPLESVPLASDDEEILGGSVRLDHSTVSGGTFVLEGGGADVGGPVILSYLGRLETLDDRSVWSRAGYFGDRWRVGGTWDRREADRLVALGPGDDLALEEERFRFFGDTTRTFLDGTLRVVAGIAHEDERADSTDPGGARRPSLLNPRNEQTLLFEDAQEDVDSAWGEATWAARDGLSVTAGLGYDDSSLHDPQWSPRVGVTWAPASAHVVHLSWGRAFRAPTLAERFLRFDLRAPLDLNDLEHTFCAPHGVPCGFDLDFAPGEDPALAPTPGTRVLALGNADLELEEVDTVDVGYRGRFGGAGTIFAGFWMSEHDDVVSTLLPQLGTSLGRTNDGLLPYAPPVSPLADGPLSELPPDVAAALLAELELRLGPLFPFLTTDVDGTPVVALSSFGNLGSVETRGVDVGARWAPRNGFGGGITYSWFDFDDGSAVATALFRANAPEHRAALEVTYRANAWGATAEYRWVDDFEWLSGPFRGPVKSYGTLNVHGDVEIGQHWTVGLTVTDLTDEETYETFGGDLLGRRALATLTLRW